MLKKTKLLLVLILTLLCLSTAIFAKDGKAVILTQYNGQAIEAYMLNDGTLTWYQDKNGYAIVKSGDVYYYASNNGYELVPTEYVVGEADPLFAGLIPNDIPKVKEDVEFKTVKDYANTITVDAPLPIVFGNVHPLVIILDKYNTDPSSYTEPMVLPESFYNDFEEFWAESSDYVKKNNVYYPDCYDPKEKDKDGKTVLYYRTSIDQPVVITHATYYYSWDMTLDKYKNEITSIDDYESLLDINNDGFIDKIIFIGPSDMPLRGSKSYSTFNNIKIGNLKAGHYSLVPAYSWTDEGTASLYSTAGIISGIGFKFLQPVRSDVKPIMIFAKQDKIIEDPYQILSGGFNMWLPVANYILGFQTKDALSIETPTGFYDEDISGDLDLWGTIQYAFANSLSQYNDSPYDVNDDSYIDCIFVLPFIVTEYTWLEKSYSL